MNDAKGRLIEMGDGSLVESDVLRIVEKVREYDENLVVKFIPPHAASVTDAPYAIFERCRDGLERLVFSVWKLDDTILERLEAADTQRHNILVDMDGRNLKVKQAKQQRFKEELLGASDIMASMLRSPKGKYSFPVENSDGSRKVITVDDSGPPKVEYKGT